MSAEKMSLYPPPNPPHVEHAHAVADGLVSRPVRAFTGWLVAVRDQGPVIRESLQALALSGSEAADGRSGHYMRVLIAHSTTVIRLEGWEYIKARAAARTSGEIPRLERQHMRLVTPTAGSSQASSNVITQLGCCTAFAATQSDRDSNYWVLPSGITCSLNPSATACKARCKVMGNSFPRLSARRSIPAHAFELKKYL